MQLLSLIEKQQFVRHLLGDDMLENVRQGRIGDLDFDEIRSESFTDVVSHMGPIFNDGKIVLQGTKLKTSPNHTRHF
jgi:hypothetical protein